MPPIHDVDSLLLLATALASKRRAAALVDIVAAIDLLQASVPGEQKLAEAFARLGTHGLLCARDNGIALSAPAEQLIAELPKRAEAGERLDRLKGLLAGYQVKGEHAAVLLDTDSIHAAIVAQRAAGKTTAKNLLVPKPKPAAETKRPGQRRRKPLSAGRVKGRAVKVRAL